MSGPRESVGVNLVIAALTATESGNAHERIIGLMAWIFNDTPIFDQVGPALLALVPFPIKFVLTSMTTLRERRTGTLERLLTLPISKLDVIIGYTLAFELLAMFQAGIAVAFSVWCAGLRSVDRYGSCSSSPCSTPYSTPY